MKTFSKNLIFISRVCEEFCFSTEPLSQLKKRNSMLLFLIRENPAKILLPTTSGNTGSIPKNNGMKLSQKWCLKPEGMLRLKYFNLIFIGFLTKLLYKLR